VRVLADASQLDGEALTGYLEREGVKRAEYEQWRLALDEGGAASTSTNKRVRQLERELARKLRAPAGRGGNAASDSGVRRQRTLRVRRHPASRTSGSVL
jgi:hypothetical protein